MKYTKVKNAQGRYNLFLDMLGSKIPNEKEIGAYKTFIIQTYTKVSGDNKDGWEINYKVVNMFFETLSKEDNVSIASGLILMHIEIDKFMASSELTEIPVLLRTLSDILVSIDFEIDLYPKLVEFSESLPAGNMANSGKRAQDTDELTFRKEHVTHLLGMVVLCKMLSPVFGTLMYHLVSRKVDSKLKEPHCITILNGIIEQRCFKLMSKLKNYVKHSISKTFEEDLTAICHGFSTNTLPDQIFSTLLVRNFVNVNLYLPNGNLMTFVSVSIKKTIQTQKHNMNQKRVAVRIEHGPGQEKKAQIDIDSISSTKSADVPMIVSYGVDKVVASMMLGYEISNAKYKKCLSYYKKNPPQIHGLNKFVIQSVFGPMLDGAKSLTLLPAIKVTMLVSVLQLTLQSIGYDELVHAISCKEGDIKTTQTDMDGRIKVNFKSIPEYKTIKNMLADSVFPKQAIKVFERTISQITENVAETNYLANTPPVLITDEEFVNGNLLQFSNELIKETCKSIELFVSF